MKHLSLKLACFVILLLQIGLVSAQTNSLSPDDIRNYGAICGSSSSYQVNTQAIESALQARGIAFIPPCAIYAGNTTLSSGNKIYGVGIASNLIAGDAVSATGLLNCIGCNGFDVESISITDTASQRTNGLSGITCTSGCSNVHIVNTTVQGNYGILITDGTSVYIDKNTVTAYGEDSGSNISGAGIAVQGTTADSHGYNCGGTPGNFVHVTNNTVSGASNGTPAGILYCQSNYGDITNNTLSSPGYFGITARGPNITQLTISGNHVYNSVHEAVIVGEGATLVSVNSNILLFGASSIDYGITLDGSEGTVTQVNVNGNTLQSCYNTCIALADTVTFSLVTGNSILNANQSNTAGEAGIALWGSGNQYNTISNNYISNTSARKGYIIQELNAQTGMPTHNVYMNNTGFNMSTGTFSIGSASLSNNNFPLQ
ncbi:right-handed parallel beta-helix repeat-containing protein [Rhodanobacter sp. A1T4]|uniref:right-handed parallel beta-helix repeat-containing protein n=1 Tax=Rhodanobacter sp. A1T4 TaxID=2723087 RepID=UPI0016106159|nr:right-handed parallel beta-helix repeat-containing protein [Rhodanobacter sp. A1T4]MBB6247747.1 hypothetical protein [Rhodanobacter sp. A1T4]